MREASAWGEPPWRVELERYPAPPPDRCDVAVVGAGLTGLAAARALAAGGARVAVLEAERVGFGGSSRSGGIVLEGTHLGPLPQMDRCLDGLRALVDELGIDCGLALPGCWELGHRRAHEASGEGPIRWSDGGRVLEPVDVVAGGVLDPGRLLAGLARAALASGASIHEGAAVKAPAALAGSPLALETSRGVVRAGAVVLGVNAWTGVLLPREQAPLTAVSFALCTAPLAAATRAELGFEPPRPFYTVDLPYLWGRTLPDGRLLVGGGLVLEEPQRLTRVRIDGGEARAQLDTLARRVRGLHPLLADVAVAARWGGPLALLRERPPMLARHPGAPQLVLAGGYSGHGVAASVQAGELAARALLAGDPLPAWGAI